MHKPFHLALAATLLFAAISSAFAQIDTQVIDQEKSTQESELSFQTFSSCQDMNTVLKKYFRDALLDQVNMYGQTNGSGIVNPSVDIGKGGMAEGLGGGGDGATFSSTNVQIEGIDEAEVIKTDGKYIYYASNTPEKDGFQYVTITKASPASDLQIVKKIKLPSNYGNIQLYLADNKLTILANKWNQNYIYNPSPISIGGGSVTVVVVYDVTDVMSPKLDRFYTVDGDYSQSRREGDYLYVISQNFVNLNIWGNTRPYTQQEINTFFDTDFSVEKAFPKSVEISRTSDVAKQLTLRGKKIPYTLSRDIVNCNEIEYILPKKPQGLSILTLSTIPLKSDAPAQKKVISGDASQFFMTKGSLYIVSSFWKDGAGDSCPPGAYCLMPIFRSEQNALIHRFSTNKSTIQYEYSVLTPGMPLSQYAMNEKDGVLFTANQKGWTTNGVDIFAIDATGKLLSKLENVGENERFQAARYIGDRLYLVTFQQVDPFFVIDTKNPNAMTILGELKLPGYSMYLHPYDATHLIGIGYDTKTSQWGGTINGGLKFDLYNVSDIKNPKQQYSRIIGGIGSSSDALWNPRALVWDGAKKTLLIPAQLMDQNQVTYQSTYAWQGLLAVKIDATSGISESGRVTHIDMTGIAEKRKQECAQYTAVVTEEKCYTLISTGEKVCIKPSDNPANQNIPAYCFAENDDSSYLANQIWNYSPYFVQRGLYIGDTLYTASPAYIQANQYGGTYSFIRKVENGDISNLIPKG